MKKLVLTVALVASVFSLGACSKEDDANASLARENVAAADEVALDSTLPPMTGAAFASLAAAGDAFEIATSKLALEKSSNRAVKIFAHEMIKAHTDSTTKLKAAAALASPSIQPDLALPSDLSVKLDQLKSEPATTFDSRYTSMQVEAHEATLTTFKEYTSSGDVTSLQNFASDLIAPVSHHLDMARALKQ